jgi:plasmid stabilization system protein ParE
LDYRLDYTDSALKDLIQIKEYIELTFLSEQAAINTVGNIITGLEKLKIFPNGGLKLSDRVDDDVELSEDYYFTFVGNHVAFYEINGEVVSVVRILGMKQDWINLLRRKK